MSLPFPEPTGPQPDLAEVLLGYLAYFRSVLVDRLRSLADDDVRTSRLPSGWTPAELLVHLTHVERRWLVWGFRGRDVGDPWGDEREGRWYVDPGTDLEALVAAHGEQAATSDAIVRAHALTDVGAPGERWDGAAPATLERILLHLVQEYARHVGQLDVVAELAGGSTGE